MSFKTLALIVTFLPLVAAENWFEKGRYYEQSGDWTSAEAAYGAFVKQNPQSAEGLSNLGVVLSHQGKYDQAIEIYKRAVKLLPASFPIHLNLGLAYFKTGKRAEAEREFRFCVHKDRSNAQARQMLAITLLESDQYAEAAPLFESLLPSADFTVRLGLATAYVRLQRTADAQRLLAELMQSENSAEVQSVLGQAYFAENDFDKAEAAFRAALTLNPELPSLHFFLGAVKWKQQDADAAMEQWREELKIDPASFEATFTLGAALAEKGDSQQADLLLRKALELRPRHPATLFYLGKIAAKQHRPEALAWLEQSVRLDPRNRAAHFLLSRIYKESGRPAEAEKERQAVRKLSVQGVREDIDILQNARPSRAESNPVPRS